MARSFPRNSCTFIIPANVQYTQLVVVACVQVQQIASKSKDNVAVDTKEYNVVVRYLLAILTFKYGINPADAVAMTVDNFVSYPKSLDGGDTLMAIGKSPVAVSSEDYDILDNYVKRYSALFYTPLRKYQNN
jgi:hypothetical protein